MSEVNIQIVHFGERPEASDYDRAVLAWQRGEGEQPEAPLFTREGEVQIGYDPGDYGRCQGSGKPLAYGRFCWNRRITNGRPGRWVLGEDWFGCVRHADGSHCTNHDGRPITECWPVPRCPKCRTENSCTTEQQPYGDYTVCTVDGCDYENYYSIGD